MSEKITKKDLEKVKKELEKMFWEYVDKINQIWYIREEISRKINEKEVKDDIERIHK